MKKVDSRILIVDDNIAIHEDFRNLLESPHAGPHDEAMASLARELFGEGEAQAPGLSYRYHLDSAHQGQEALDMILQAREAGNPYWLVYMDVRMPPGMDGIQTTRKIWETSPETQVVICSAYSDYSWDNILGELGERDNLFFIRKPFDPVAVKQSALTFSKKWQLLQENKLYTQNLEAQVKERTQELEKTIEALKEQKEISDRSAKAKTVFLSNMSHEIRTPLHGIIGMADILAAQDLDAEKQEQVKTIASSSKMLLNIINEILDYSKIEAGRLELDEVEVDLRCLVECVCDLLAPTAHDKEIELLAMVESTAPKRVLADPLRVRQVLLNLANNAIKFTRAGGHVIIDVQTTPQADGKVRCDFSVKDQGIGIDQKHLELIFTPYSQTEKSISRRYGGTGLGLSICKKLVQAMGGEISATSELDCGSIFEFYFDAPKMDDQNLKQHPLDGNITGHCLYVVGDNKAHYEILKQYTDDWGVSCQHIETEQINTLSVDSGDFVFVDLVRGDIDEYKALEVELRKVLSPKHQVGALIRYGNRLAISELKKHNYMVALYRPVKYRALYTALKALQAPAAQDPPKIQRTESGNDGVPLITSRAGMRVLVVEDNVVNQQVIAGILKPMGVEVRIAGNGQEALDTLATSDKFDLVFMDVNMPVIDGIAASKAIRAQSRFDGMPIVALSADAFHSNKEECLAAGMNDFVSKPFTSKMIVSVIDKVILTRGGGPSGE